MLDRLRPGIRLERGEESSFDVLTGEPEKYLKGEDEAVW